MRILNLTGSRFGRLVVICTVGKNRHNKRMWLCQCDCGEFTTTTSGDLRSSGTTSCGCIQRERTSAANTIHGGSGDAAYTSWKEMIRRCSNPKSSSFSRYGGRGISVCERWNNYLHFKEDMGERPSGKTLDRINPNGNYEPSNCRWATSKTQSRNRRNSRFLIVGGVAINLVDVAVIMGVHRSTVGRRYRCTIVGEKDLTGLVPSTEEKEAA